MLELKEGETYGSWLLVKDFGKPFCLCRCSCGSEDLVNRYNLASRLTDQCRSCSATSHDLSKTKDYVRWTNMIACCYREDHPDYKNYGERRIYVSEEFQDPRVFIDWWRSLNPNDRDTLERRNNDGPYSRENCYAATRIEQNRNRRNATWVEFNGEMMLISEAAKKSGIDENTLRARISNYPDNPEIWFKEGKLNRYKDISRPIKNEEGDHHYFNFIDTPWGRMMVSEAARKIGITGPSLKARMKKHPDHPELWWETGKRLRGEFLDTPWGYMSITNAAHKANIDVRTLKSRMKTYPELPSMWWGLVAV